MVLIGFLFLYLFKYRCLCPLWRVLILVLLLFHSYEGVATSLFRPNAANLEAKQEVFGN